MGSPVCMCGCGQLTVGQNAHFRIGHGTKLRAKAERIHAGLQTMEDLPMYVRNYLAQCGTCDCCGHPLTTPGIRLGPECASGRCNCTPSEGGVQPRTDVGHWTGHTS